MQGTVRLGPMALILCSIAATAPAAPARPEVPSMAGVAWSGPGVPIESLRGKTVVVLSYVTWCPICNEWSPKLCQQIKDAAADKPVVIIALSTETPTVSGPVYMGKRNFVAPNILHGHDPKINAKLKLKEEGLFNYAIIDPTGKVVAKGEAGSYYGKEGSEEYAMAREITKLAPQGNFLVITPEMSPALKEMLWPVELGFGANDAFISKVRRSLKPDEAKQLDAALDRYLSDRLEQLRTSASGTVPERLAAFEIATNLSAQFKSSPQGRESRQILIELNKDSALKREVTAKIAYDKLVQAIASKPDQRDALVNGFVRTFAGTYYAGLAKEQLGE
ncbi:MAG TPA: redoxin domain-containing protein [Pirellulales bacterium]|nr:redoxin domain-containing protein [Pirellulales bacterium]